MKKFSGLFMAAILGGMVSVGVIKITEETPQTAVVDKINNNSKLVSYSTAPAEIVNDFTTAAEASVNAVVHVTTEYMQAQNQYSNDPFYEFFYGSRGGNIQPSPAKASGSGVILSSDGYIATNRHVVKGADKVRIALNDKRTYEAKVIGTDPSTDLALLKVDAKDLPFVPYGNSDEVKVGEWVLAVGNPYNLTSTVTAGIVSAKGRNINILESDPIDGLPAIESFIQTDAAVNPGNSGGALVSTNGQLVGINTAIKSNTGSYAGYSFAIPVNIVRKVVDDLLEFGVVQRAFIGVSIRDINQAFAREEGIESLSGVYISGVSEDGAAKDAGIEKGDIITKIGSAQVGNVPELQEQVGKFRPGDEIIVTYERGGEEKEATLVLKNKHGKAEVVAKNNSEVASMLGAHFAPVSKDEMSKLRIDNGLKVTKLTNGKLRSSGIRDGFIITHVDKKPINNYEDLSAALDSKKGGVLIEGVYSNGMRSYYGFGL